MKVLALAGGAGDGKDEVASILAGEFGFERLSFAKKLKDIARQLLGGPEEVYFGPSKLRNEPFNHYEALDLWWLRVWEVFDSPRFKTFVFDLFSGSAVGTEDALEALRVQLEDFQSKGANLTPRYVLQRLGTEWGRALWQDVWLHAVKKQIGEGRYVITDCRFLNEAEFVKNELEGVVVYVDATYRLPRNRAISHASEPTLTTFGDAVGSILDNNGTLQDLPIRVRSLAKRLGFSRSA